MEQHGKGTIHLKRQKCESKEEQKGNIVFGQVSLPQTNFRDDGDRIPCDSSWRLSFSAQDSPFGRIQGKKWPP